MRRAGGGAQRQFCLLTSLLTQGAKTHWYNDKKLSLLNCIGARWGGGGGGVIEGQVNLVAKY